MRRTASDLPIIDMCGHQSMFLRTFMDGVSVQRHNCRMMPMIGKVSGARPTPDTIKACGGGLRQEVDISAIPKYCYAHKMQSKF